MLVFLVPFFFLYRNSCNGLGDRRSEGVLIWRNLRGLFDTNRQDRPGHPRSKFTSRMLSKLKQNVICFYIYKTCYQQPFHAVLNAFKTQPENVCNSAHIVDYFWLLHDDSKSLIERFFESFINSSCINMCSKY